MDDLFQGYMVLDVLGEFLEDDTLINHNKQPAMAPQPERNTQRFDHPEPTSRSELDQHGQKYALARFWWLDTHTNSFLAPNDNVGATTGSRQRRVHTKSRLGCLGCKKRKIKVFVSS